ncbi:MAG: class I SAM-dependent methyltransferase [Oscillospiraceae bacterium]|jgi:SAM-dependent methyltransferase|nr:class I SAM-dependent methyltransferase [Oscillospiraceae bacterium]
MNESARQSWNQWAETCLTENDRISLELIQEDPRRAFPRDVWDMVTAATPDLRGKRVLVPSSGDNLAAFGFHLLGAKVTSADLAEKQLENAARIADAHGWDMEFRQADSMTLDGLPDGTYDLIHTSNGAHVWISDLGQMYHSFHRALRPGGAYVFFDTHPFNRPFDDHGKRLKVVRPYAATQPFHDPPEYPWRVEDILRALLGAGFALRDYRDIQSGPDDIMAFGWFYRSYAQREQDRRAKYDWIKNPGAALPSWMGVSARKEKTE